MKAQMRFQIIRGGDLTVLVSARGQSVRRFGTKNTALRLTIRPLLLRVTLEILRDLPLPGSVILLMR